MRDFSAKAAPRVTRPGPLFAVDTDVVGTYRQVVFDRVELPDHEVDVLLYGVAVYALGVDRLVGDLVAPR